MNYFDWFLTVANATAAFYSLSKINMGNASNEYLFLFVANLFAMVYFMIEARGGKK
jgi:hypothetical protein